MDELGGRPIPSIERLRRYAHAMLEPSEDRARVQVRSDLWTALGSDDKVCEKFVQAVQRRRRVLREWIRAGVETGELAQIPANALASILLALAMGLLLLALPQMYGVGYPVVQMAAGGKYLLWFVIVLMLAKILAASLTIGIGGSGGILGPSLFIGSMLAMAFGMLAHLIWGAGVGASVVYGMIAMGAVFAGAARALVTSVASVFEMTGDYRIIPPLMLGVAVATGLSSQLSCGSIYTTKLLRRGIDVERPKPATLMQAVRVGEAMRPLPGGVPQERPLEEMVIQLGVDRVPGQGRPAVRTKAPKPCSPTRRLSRRCASWHITDTWAARPRLRWP